MSKLNFLFAIALIATLGNAALFEKTDDNRFGGLKQIQEVILFTLIINTSLD
jgi:hypothetical protein